MFITKFKVFSAAVWGTGAVSMSILSMSESVLAVFKSCNWLRGYVWLYCSHFIPKNYFIGECTHGSMYHVSLMIINANLAFNLYPGRKRFVRRQGPLILKNKGNLPFWSKPNLETYGTCTIFFIIYALNLLYFCTLKSSLCTPVLPAPVPRSG